MDKVQKDAQTNKGVDYTVLMRQRLSENKVFFYGFPFIVILIVIIGLYLAIIPAFQYYFDSKIQNEVLDQNLETVSANITNLNNALKEEDKLKSYNDSLTAFIPTKSRLGDLIVMIENKAEANSLTRVVTNTSSPSDTSANKLAEKGKTNIVESFVSGEVKFEPKSLPGKNVDATLISISLNVRGSKTSFNSFIEQIKNSKPLINLVSIDYSENTLDQTSTVSATMRFESYALNLKSDTENESITKIEKNDPILVVAMNIDEYSVNPKVIKTIK